MPWRPPVVGGPTSCSLISPYAMVLMAIVDRVDLQIQYGLGVPRVSKSTGLYPFLGCAIVVEYTY